MPVFSGIFHKPKLLGVRFHLQFLRHCHVVTLQNEEESSHMILFKSNSCNFSLWMPVLPPFARHWQAIWSGSCYTHSARIGSKLNSSAGDMKRRCILIDTIIYFAFERRHLFTQSTKTQTLKSWLGYVLCTMVTRLGKQASNSWVCPTLAKE